MTIATTRRYNPTVEEITEQAFDLAGITGSLRTAYDLQKAAWMLNDILLDWQNSEIPLWLQEELTISTVAGTASYDITVNTMEIKHAFYRLSQSGTQFDYPIERITLEEYSDISTKTQAGRPNLYYFEKTEVVDVTSSTDRAATVTLWPVPDIAASFVYQRERKVVDSNEGDFDTSIGSLTLEIPQRFIPALKRRLAFELAASSRDPMVLQKAQALEMLSTQMQDRAFAADREKGSNRFVPRYYHQ